MTIRLRVRHHFIDWLRFTGIRERLRCPNCRAVGTWKPHGGLWDRDDERKVRRWLCKWCGHYVGPEGVRTAVIDKRRRVWTLPEDLQEVNGWWITPQTLVQSALGNTWPWRG